MCRLLIAWLLLLTRTGSKHTGLVALQQVGSSQTRNWIHAPFIGRWILNHWTTRKVWLTVFRLFFFCLGPWPHGNALTHFLWVLEFPLLDYLCGFISLLKDSLESSCLIIHWHKFQYTCVWETSEFMHLHSVSTQVFLTLSVSSVQLLSCVQLIVTPRTTPCKASLSITNPQSLLNSCPSSWWCHPTISSSVFPFSSCLQSFPASGFFPVSQFFTLSGQSIGVSALASVVPVNIQDWFPLGWTSWISLHSKGLSKSCL